MCRESNRERLDAIGAAERAITKELVDLEKVFESWVNGEPGRPRSAKGPTRQRSDEDEDDPGEVAFAEHVVTSRVETMFHAKELPPEVLAVERILREEGGTTGGWEERDHERFLRYRTQHRGQPHVYIQKTSDDLPAHDVTSVKAHERWYIRYLGLLQAKKAAIRTWRTSRARPQTSGGTAGADDTNGGFNSTPAHRRPASAQAPRGQAGAAEAEAERRDSVRKWREERERERREREAAAAEAERARNEERRQREAEERAQEKERLLRYRQSKVLALPTR